MIHLRKPLFVMLVALCAAIGIGSISTAVPYHEKLIRIQAEHEIGPIAPRILEEPLETQAMLLDYAAIDAKGSRNGDKELVLKAWIALSKYPDQSRQIFKLYGSEPDFQTVLRNFGEPVIPVIKYFYDTDLVSLRARDAVINGATVTVDKVRGILVIPFKKVKNAVHTPDAKVLAPQLAGKVPSEPGAQPTAEPAAVLAATPVAPPAPANHIFGAQDRGWYAVKFIQTDGHKFLGQFSVDPKKEAHWNQVDRVTAGMAGFFLGGLSNLERKYELDESIGAPDIIIAGMDVIPFVAALKFAKAGKVLASSGKELNMASRTKLFAARLIPKSENLKWMGKYAGYGATAYIVVKHPELLNSLFRELAVLMGLNPDLVQFLCWFLLVSIALYPCSWLLKLLTNSLLFGLSWLSPSRRHRKLKEAPVAATALAA